MKSYYVVVQLWLVALVSCMAAVAVSFLYADVPMALFFSKSSNLLSPVGESLSSVVILSVEAVTVMALVLTRLVRGRLPPLAEAAGVACLTSICVYGIDSGVLKPVFGVPNPGEVLHGAKHAFNFFAGSPYSSFPSGHMTLAAAFAGVFMRLYRQSIWPLSALLVFGAALLVAGEWHFLSDVIAGTFVGLSAGLLAAELWDVHSN